MNLKIYNLLGFIVAILLTPNYFCQARRTASSLQRIRQGAQRRGGASSDVSDQNVSDTDKISMQIFLDIQVRTGLQICFQIFLDKICVLCCVTVSAF